MSAQPPRFAITATQIDLVVQAFYARVREHDILGPVFYETLPPVTAVWVEHEDKIAAFWRNAILFERGYSGNPQRVHSQREAVEPAHFAIWLALFDEVLRDELPPELAAAWSNLAHRIGQGLRMGVVQSKQRHGDVPNLG